MDNLQTDANLFADDTSLVEVVLDPLVSANRLNHDLRMVGEWSDQWLVTFNPLKTELMTFSMKRVKVYHPPLVFKGVVLKEVDSHKHLGLNLKRDLSWSYHVSTLITKAMKRINLLKRISYFVPRGTLETLYVTMIRPLLEYADIVWCGLLGKDCDLLESVQMAAARVCTGAMRGTKHESLLAEVAWDTLADRRKKHQLIQFWKIMNGLAPLYLHNIIPPRICDTVPYNLRANQNLTSIACKTEKYKRSFLPSTVHLWNELPTNAKAVLSINTFKKELDSLFNKPTKYSHFSYGQGRSAVHLTRLRLNFSQLNYHLFQHHCIDYPTCKCGYHCETTEHYLLHCTLYTSQRSSLLSAVSNIIVDLKHLNDTTLCTLLLSGSTSLSHQQNCNIFDLVITYIHCTGRFS